MIQTQVNLPQLAVLPAIVRNLYHLPPVQAVYLTGSFGRGGGDEWSDLDLQVHMESGFSDFLTDAEIQNVISGSPLSLERFKVGSDGWMHHMILADGTFVDLLCRTDLSAEKTEIWMYLPPDMTSLPRAVTHHPKGWTPKPISPAEVTALVNRFWIVMHKHRRMARQQDLVNWTGIHYSVALLIRLEFIADIGQDCGDLTRMGMYELSGVNDWLTQSAMNVWLTRSAIRPNIDPFPADCTRTNWEGQVNSLMKSGQNVTWRLSKMWALTPDPIPLLDLVSQNLRAMLTSQQDLAV